MDNAVDSCIADGILVDVLKKERDKVTNILYRGLTEEEKKELEILNREYYIEMATERTKLDAVDRLVAEGTFDVSKACEILEVSLDAYNEYLKNRQNSDESN